MDESSLKLQTSILVKRADIVGRTPQRVWRRESLL